MQFFCTIRLCPTSYVIPMRSLSVHPNLYFIALVACMLNMAATVGGAVRCEDPTGESSIEFACDHNHCEDTEFDGRTSNNQHVHDDDFASDGGCNCSTSSCPCEDTPLEIVVAPLLGRDDATHVDQSATAPSPFDAEQIQPAGARFANLSSPRFHSLQMKTSWSFLHLSTIILIV